MHKKNIAIDIQPLATQLKKHRGIGYSTYRLVKELISLSSSNHNYVFYTTSQEKLEEVLPGTDIIHVSDKAVLPFYMKKDDIRLVHFNDYFFPLYDPAQFLADEYESFIKVITVYDMIPFYFPNRRDGVERIRENLFTILERIDMIRANSYDTKKELMRFTEIESSKIKVIYHGIDHTIFHNNYSAEEINIIREYYGLKKDFILQVGAMDWRKNQITLLKAYKELLENTNTGLQLVFVGSKPKKEHSDFVKKNRLEKQVIFLENVPQEHLPLIYNAAKLFAYPSLYEGFGNPPLEALACGLPVISSKVGSLPEILGDCPIYVPCQDETKLAEAIYKLYSKPKLQNKMIKAGLKQAQRFSWQKTAEELSQLYDYLLR